VPYLIDAANLGGALGGAGGARNSEAILAFLLPWARNRKQVVVVFDGPERPEMAKQLGGVEIVWSGRMSADDVIAKRIGGAGKSASSWTVVTADRALARRCRDQGAKVEPASTFAKRAAGGPPKAHPARRDKSPADKPAPSAQEIAHWREVFGGAKRRG
jgi:hypothetical protein